MTTRPQPKEAMPTYPAEERNNGSSRNSGRRMASLAKRHLVLVLLAFLTLFPIILSRRR